MKKEPMSTPVFVTAVVGGWSVVLMLAPVVIRYYIQWVNYVMSP